MTALPVASARHSSFSHQAHGGLFVGITSAYRKVALRVMAQAPARSQNDRGRTAAGANTLLREHSALGVVSL